MTAYTINFDPICRLDDERFYTLCRANPDVRFERNAKGAIIIVAPTGRDTGIDNSEINADFVIWNRRTQLGKVFASSTGFKLPNGSNRSPDVAWVRQERWDALPPEQRTQFPPIAPDFVLELMSPSDPPKNSLAAIQSKMREYQENGVRLGWLLARQLRRVAVYRLGQAVAVLADPATLSGEDVLPGFVLTVRSRW